MRKLDFKEARQRMLLVLQEMDRYCKENNLTCMLAFGTLIGAIRHGGFIPWDDDIDVMMPWKDYMKFCETYENENFKVLDINHDYKYRFSFARLVDKKSFQIKKGVKGDGICIDIYPIFSISEKDYFNRILPKFKSIIKKKRKLDKIIKGLDMLKLGIINKLFIRYRHKLLSEMVAYFKESEEKNSEKLICYGGGEKDYSTPLQKKLLNNGVISCMFENVEAKIPKEYDYFLRAMYGDYMQLPPEDQRHPYHGGNFYIDD